MTLVDDYDRPDRIEADLEKNRNGLASALDELTNRASVDYVAREALGLFKVNTAEATRSLDRAMRSNPMAFALMGAGVVWMVLGGQGKTKAVTDPNPEWHSHLGSMRDKARDTLARLEDEARSGMDSLKSGLQDQMGQVRDFAAERAQVIEDFASDLKSAIASGLEHLTESARDGVMQARQESYSALFRAERVVKGGTREAVALVEEHPVATGAVALAIGAVAGMAFLRSGEAERHNDPGWWADKVTPAKANPLRPTGGVSTGGPATHNAGREPMM
ncbi:MAG: hypothetical protein CFE34_15125 [Rhodobacteraceae bacterium PARR1]|nr:MAG: hypothetical protein CFE34_15125 [Rhodobacteraceae bacterium PARR1]